MNERDALLLEPYPFAVPPRGWPEPWPEPLDETDADFEPITDYDLEEVGWDDDAA